MTRDQDLVEMIDQLQADMLDRWIALGWVIPVAGATGATFDAADVARVRLICDLVYDFEVGEEGVPVILSLLDQLHDARRMLRVIGAAIDAQPDDVRRQIASEMKHALGHGE